MDWYFQKPFIVSTLKMISSTGCRTVSHKHQSAVLLGTTFTRLDDQPTTNFNSEWLKCVVWEREPRPNFSIWVDASDDSCPITLPNNKPFKVYENYLISRKGFTANTPTFQDNNADIFRLFRTKNEWSLYGLKIYMTREEVDWRTRATLVERNYPSKKKKIKVQIN